MEHVSSIGSHKIYYRIAEALWNSGSVEAAAKDYKKNSLLSFVDDHLPSPICYSNVDEKHERFAYFFLCNLLDLVLDATPSEIIVFENTRIGFSLENRHGFLSFNEIDYAYDGEADFPPKTTLYQVSISAFTQTMAAMCDGETSDGIDLRIAKLIENNRLLELIEERFSNSGNGAPSCLGKKIWEKQRIAILAKGGRPSFPIVGCNEDILGPMLRDFFKYGTLPKKNKRELGDLFWRFCVFNLYENSDAYVHHILKDVQHLDLIAPNVELNPNQQLRDITNICKILARHFKGNTISFNGIRVGRIHNDTALICGQSIVNLIKYNPNIKALRFILCPIMTWALPKLAEVLRTNNTLIELSLDSSIEHRPDLHALRESLKHNLTLKVLRLNNSHVEFKDILDFIEIPSISILSLQNNSAEFTRDEQEMITRAVELSRTLVSFEMGTKLDADLAEECQHYLMRNRLHQDYIFFSKLFFAKHWMESEGIPFDVYHFIFRCLSDVSQVSDN